MACTERDYGVQTLNMKEDEERHFKIELRNAGSSALGHIAGIRADLYTAESSFETKQSLDLLSNTNEAVLRVTNFPLLKKKKSLECDDIVTLEIVLRGQPRCKRVHLHITYAQHLASKCTRCLTLCCEMKSIFSSAVLREVRVLAKPPVKCVPHIRWSRFHSETDSNLCTVLLDVENNYEDKTVSVCLNDQNDVVSVKPNRIESIYAIIPRCDSKDNIKSWFEKHFRIRLNGRFCDVDVSTLSLRHFIRPPIRIDMKVSNKKDASLFKIGDTLQLTSLVKLLNSNVIVLSSEIFIWHSSSSARSIQEMVSVGDICVSGNTKRNYCCDDEDEEQHEPLKHLLAFTPLVSGQYYASTCVCISTKDDAEKHRAVWWNGILSLKVE